MKFASLSSVIVLYMLIFIYLCNLQEIRPLVSMLSDQSENMGPTELGYNQMNKIRREDKANTKCI